MNYAAADDAAVAVASLLSASIAPSPSLSETGVDSTHRTQDIGDIGP